MSGFVQTLSAGAAPYTSAEAAIASLLQAWPAHALSFENPVGTVMLWLIDNVQPFLQSLGTQLYNLLATQLFGFFVEIAELPLLAFLLLFQPITGEPIV
jgi:hypothetical protein